MMSLLPGWGDRLAQTTSIATIEPQILRLPLSTEAMAREVRFVDNADAAAAMAQLARERAVTWIGIDTEYRYDRPPVSIRGGSDAYDVRSVHPLLLSLALMEKREGEVNLFRFVVDLRRTMVFKSLDEVLNLPVPFVAHYASVELYCLWQLGLNEPRVVWDTWVAEKAAVLGLNNRHYHVPAQASVEDQIAADEEAARLQAGRLTLVGTCGRHGVEYLLADAKERLQKSFLTHREDASFSQEQIKYAALDAEAAARLYLPQIQAATVNGTLDHLKSIEMPWTIVNARMAWNGVRIDRQKTKVVATTCVTRLAQLDREIAGMGIQSARSHKQLQAYFGGKGLLASFWKAGKITFEKEILKPLQHLDPVIPLLHELRKIQSFQADQVLNEKLDGIDGRVHPDHRQLGADSGRQSCRWPNLLGLDRTMRPLIVPEPGYGIGEVDLCQIEVGIAAACYGDDTLVRMFNEGDVYSAMAQKFYADCLDPQDVACDGETFKKSHPNLRDVMKTCTLGIIYGLTSYGLAPRLKKTKQEAANVLEQFMAMFPVLKLALDAEVYYGPNRGYATTITGLRRHRVGRGAPGSWEKNWARNHPVQGSAAAAFKLAGIRLDKLYPAYNAKLIIPMHDAYVFEAPVDQLQAVGKLTERVLCEAVQELFPVLRPRAEINNKHPECWNKEGQADALQQWLTSVDRDGSNGTSYHSEQEVQPTGD